MTFASSAALRAEVLTACRVLSHFRIAEGFGHVSARLPQSELILITPRRALALVSEAELVELDLAGRQIAGTGKPPLEVAMHLAVYRARPDVTAIARGHPRHVAAFAAAGAPLAVAHGLAASLAPTVPVFRQPYLVASAEMGDAVAQALGAAAAVILQANGMLTVGSSVAHACVHAMLLEEAAQIALLAAAGGLAMPAFSPETAARRHADDRVHEPVRAWEYYVAVAEGKVTRTP